MPAVTVIIPTRNRFDLALEAVASVQAQTFGDFEVVVVDDASDDGSFERLQVATEDDPRVRFCRHSTCQHAQQARATGLDASDSRYVATLDSDDVWLPQKLERQVGAAEAAASSASPDGDDRLAVVCNHAWVGADGTTRKAAQITEDDIASGLPATNMSTLFCTRSALDAVGGFYPPDTPSLATAANIELYLRLAQACRFVIVPEVLAECRDHAGARNSDLFKTRTGADTLAAILAHHDAWLTSHRERQSWLEQRTGARYLEIGETRLGIRYLNRAVRHRRIGDAVRMAVRYTPLTLKSLSRSAPRTAA